MRTFDAVVIGGGAAGLYFALEAGRRGRKVLVIERNAQVGRKILISGGGRCNFTNIHTTADNFISKNPHFCKSALAVFTPHDFVELVKKHRIEFYEKKLGQLFCRESSRLIVEMLVTECKLQKVTIIEQCNVESVTGGGNSFRIETSSGIFECGNLVIATGGLSFAKVGATDLGYSIARQFGLKIEPTRPSLVPLVFSTNDKRSAKLAGVSVDSIVATDGQSFRENILFTHRGLSGPAILQISNYWNKSDAVTIDLLPEIDLAEVIQSHATRGKTVGGMLRQILPEKVVGELCTENLRQKTVSDVSRKDIEALVELIGNWHVRFNTTEGYDKAEVTLGGVSTDELSSKSMESRKVPGLFFIGEVVDVTGWLGGYNFQWAWSSGHAAATAI